MSVAPENAAVAAAAKSARSAPPPAPISRRDDALEGLRGLAALTVFWAHLGLEFGHESRAVSALLWPAPATAAVMIFFVLSGYVIGLAHPGAATPQRLRDFGWRRVLRLWPINLAGVLLACAAASEIEPGALLGNLFGLQNYNDYFGLYIAVLPTNGNLWSLNYEVVYYAAFALLWWRGTSVSRTTLVTLLLGLATWFGPASGVFIACYAFGFLFWLGGLALARHATRTAEENINWPTWLLVALVTWKLNTLRDAMFALPWAKPYFLGPVVRLYYLDFLPVSLVLVAAISRSSFPALRGLKIAALAIPGFGLARQLLLAGGPRTGETLALALTAALALALWRWAPSLWFFRRCAPLGLISYALYATSRPIQEMVFQHRAFFGAGFAANLLAAAVACALSFGVAWYLERRLQPALTRWARVRP